MSTTQASNLIKAIAWNRTSIQIPETWEVDSLDYDHLIIGRETRPKLELKWIESPKRFALDKFIKKFIKQTQRQLRIQVHEQATPSSFSHPNPKLDFFFFSWSGNQARGFGTLVFCRECKRLTLIRFFKTNHLDPQSKDILLTFCDHSENGKDQWEVFGLKAETPNTFRLKDFSFKPGFFKIILNESKKNLILYNWGPASFLLSQKDLSQFAVEQLPQLSGLAQAGQCRHGSYLEWSFAMEKFKNAHILPIAKMFHSYVVFRICHHSEKNRILGIWIQSNIGYDHDLMKGSFLGDI